MFKNFIFFSLKCLIKILSFAPTCILPKSSLQTQVTDDAFKLIQTIFFVLVYDQIRRKNLVLSACFNTIYCLFSTGAYFLSHPVQKQLNNNSSHIKRAL